VRFSRRKKDEPQLEGVRRLARELAERRDAAYAEVQAEVESMKAALRERATAIAERERELRTANGTPADLAVAKELMRRAEAELKLAEAERARLEEREQRIRAVEKELAALRIELTQGRSRPPVPADDRELDVREAALAAREAALVAQRFTVPPAPSFAEGLAALARSRNR
jgi:DNA repair exonuclease SbcCD ATPase subunit